MDRERAETHLRLLIEAELRRGQPDFLLVMTVEDVLVSAGALGPRIAEELLTQTIRDSAESDPEPSPPLSGTERLLPLRQSMNVGDDQERADLTFLLYAQNSVGARFYVHLHCAEALRSERGPALLDRLRMTDDSGARYRLGFKGSGATDYGFTGRLAVTPEPPSSIRWAEIMSPGGPVQRIDLAGPEPVVAIGITPKPQSAGEYVLHTMAGRLLVRGEAYIDTEILDHVVAALIAADALAPDSPVPGQIAGRCGRGSQDPPPIRTSAYAPIAVAVPDLDGSQVVVLLGMASSAGQTFLQVHVADPGDTGPSYDGPALWLRDSRGGWHTTAYRARSGLTGEWTDYFRVMPPIYDDSAVDLIAIGRTTEARVTLPPLKWR